jgi:hypothetical protein
LVLERIVVLHSLTPQECREIPAKENEHDSN